MRQIPTSLWFRLLFSPKRNIFAISVFVMTFSSKPSLKLKLPKVSNIYSVHLPFSNFKSAEKAFGHGSKWVWRSAKALLWVAIWSLWGCSTTNHAILPTQAFHDITSHYNAYFNAHEKLKGTLQSVAASHKDKFDSVIAVYPYNDSKEFASYNSDLEDVVKRSTQAIQLHNISNWSDDHMLLIGEAYYLKGDYDKASSSFKYITTEFKDGVDYVKVMRGLGKPLHKYVRAKKKKKKAKVKVVTNADGTKSLEKEDTRPKYSIWVHEPARSEALIWLVNTYTRQGKFDKAGSVVTFVRSDDNFYKNLDPKLDLADADLKVSSKNYAGAIEPLENYLKAKSIRKKKRLKGRPLFVLAQCYEMTGNYPKAISNYKLVLKNRPTYDMEFYAKLKMAKLGRASSKDNAAIRSLLAKMAKDGKYKDYLDQIYYELALISLQESSRDQARIFLHKSVDFSVDNDDQKALSYLQLAEMDYEDEAYVNSKFFYDSTLTFMAKNDKRYPDIEERNKLLESLVTQLNIIAEEDSLQKLAALPKEQQEQAVKDAMAKKEKEAEDKKAAEETKKQQLQLNNFTNSNQPKVPSQQSSGSTWYFYNTTARAAGYNDFIKKWGRRKLEPDWRRKDKTAMTADEVELFNSAEGDTGTSAAKEEKVVTGTPEEQMLAGIPNTPEKQSKSNERLVDAYYTAGTIYKDGLEAYDKAREMFETLNNRVKQHRLLLESYYNLYLIAQQENDNAGMEKYKHLILAEFPESVIAKILKDPNYIKQLMQKDLAVNTYYEEVYNDYNSGNLDSAWYKCKMSNTLFKSNPLEGKFDLLLALILAKQNKLDEYVQALNKIVSNGKDVEVQKAASDLLSLLNKSSLPQVDLSKDTLLRDSLNAQYTPTAPASPAVHQGQPNQPSLVHTPTNGTDTSGTAIPETKAVSADTTAKVIANSNEATDTTGKTAPATNHVMAEDTTSPYQRSDNLPHYFIVYIKDPAASQNAVMSIIAKLNAFNSTQFDSRRLQTKQVIIDSKNKLINVRTFKNREDVMEYYKVIKNQGQLFSDLQTGQYAITCISTLNFGTLLSEKDIDAYNKYFNRVYGK